jgi:pyruvate/2-oxoglutarate dehydrogenase complex dihydrolipoamide acyltransferase (E2) component
VSSASGLSGPARALRIGLNTSAPVRGQEIMATDILLPKLGFSMTEGQIAEWLVADGAQVSEGDPLYLLEADKSTNEVEAPASGTLRIAAEVGETYEVGTVLGHIE